MLKTKFAALAVSAVLASGAAFAADQTPVATPATTASQPAATAPAATETKAPVKHVKHHAKAETAPEAASTTKSN